MRRRAASGHSSCAHAWLVPVVTAVWAVAGLVGWAGAVSDQAVTGSGCSVSVPGYLADLARAYERETGVPILVLGGGSMRGLVDLQQGRTDFAASCQSKSAFDPEDFTYITAAWDALVFVVHPSNPIESISAAEVQGIYQGRTADWSQLGGPALPLVSMISTPEGMGGIGEALAKFILRGQRPAPQKNSAMQASSVAIWEQLVEEMPGGFASTGFGSARKRRVKMLKVDGVAPTKDTIISGAYPYRRPLYIVIRKNPKPEVRRFVDYVLSERGQALISSFGMPSLNDVK